MSIWLKIFDRCGQPIFIVLAFLTLIIWFPLLVAWTVVDPRYRWAMWRKKHLSPKIKPISYSPIPTFVDRRFQTVEIRPNEKKNSIRPPMKGNEKS